MSAHDVYTDTAKAVARATHPQSRDVLLLTLHTIGYLLESDEDGLAHDLFQDWATAAQEAGERA